MASGTDSSNTRDRTGNRSNVTRLCINVEHSGQIALRLPLVGEIGRYSAMPPAGLRGARHFTQ